MDAKKAPTAIPDRRLRRMDWVALGSLGLAIAWTMTVDAGLAAAKNGDWVDLTTSLWIQGLGGLIAEIAALAQSKGRPKWPGVSALFSPVVSGFGLIAAFEIVWHGLS